MFFQVWPIPAQNWEAFRASLQVTKIWAGLWAESEHALLLSFPDRPSTLAQEKPISAHFQCLWSALVQAFQNHSVKLSFCIPFLFLPLMLQHRSESCPLISLPVALPLWLPQSHASWIFSLLFCLCFSKDLSLFLLFCFFVVFSFYVLQMQPFPLHW